MKNKIKKALAVFGFAAIGATSTGCNVRVDNGKNGNYTVQVNLDDKDKDDIVKRVIERCDDRNAQTTYAQSLETATETTYTQTLKITSETITTESNTTELTYYTAESTEQTTEETKETKPGVYVENRYKIEDGMAGYKVTKEPGEYLYSIARKFDKENTNETLKSIKELNKIDENDNFISKDRAILLPFDALYYIIKQGPGEATTLDEISNLTGIPVTELSGKDNIASNYEELEDGTEIILKGLKKGETSFRTENGLANIYQGTVIHADKLIASTGYSGASNHLLALIEKSETENRVEYLKFDGYGNYTTTLVANDVEDIRAEDGYLIIVKNDNTKVYGSGSKLIRVVEKEKQNVKTKSIW